MIKLTGAKKAVIYVAYTRKKTCQTLKVFFHPHEMWINIIWTKLNMKQECWPSVSFRVSMRGTGGCVRHAWILQLSFKWASYSLISKHIIAHYSSKYLNEPKQYWMIQCDPKKKTKSIATFREKEIVATWVHKRS